MLQELSDVRFAFENESLATEKRRVVRLTDELVGKLVGQN